MRPFLLYCDACYDQYVKRLAADLYMAEMLKNIGLAVGIKTKVRLADILFPHEIAEDSRSGDEIAADVVARLGLVVSNTDDDI